MQISLPIYSRVGVYTYKINEVNGKVSGVTYDGTNLFMRVQVTEENGALVTHPVFYYGTYSPYDVEAGTKVDKITNTYSAGNLAITKKITGNLGAKDKYFQVTVTFTVPVGVSMNSDVTVAGGKYTTAQSVVAVATNQDVRAWITLDHTSIDYPILQGATNLTYINANVYGEFALAGSIFLNTRSDGSFKDRYSLIYGHDMIEGRMFGDLSLYKDEKFFQENSTGKLILPDRTYDLTVYAVLILPSSDETIFNPETLEVELFGLLELLTKARYTSARTNLKT